ncbi:RodZ domain-containing protein [Desulfovibrio cuneatus]|uniref:RodZ domain-containing protein n=1 Tax=Desulfovibrio cuneatus TaxID=159728 RepID=UPI0003FDF6D9|nr:RodZ domain-containing protein [Desulfovibrio cuneatus]
MTLLELGQEIRGRREALDFSIDEVAGRIKVSARILRAIEEGNLSGLPHAVYTRGFIRAYASLVGLEAEQLAKALETIFPPDEGEELAPVTPAFTRPVPAGELGKRLAIIVFILLLLAGVVGGGWYITTTYGSKIIELVKQPFSAVTPSTGVTPIMAVANSSLENPQITDVHQAEPAPQEAQDASQHAEPTMEAGQLATSAGTVAASQPATPPANPAASQEGLNQHERAAIAANKQIVYISATEDCYLGITADNGKLIHHMLKANESYPVVFTDSLKLLLGNAGGISIRYNGKDLGEIGAKGKPRLLLFPM